MRKTLFPRVRPRRLRLNETIRDLVSETSINKSKLIQPLFVSGTLKKKEEALKKKEERDLKKKIRMEKALERKKKADARALKLKEDKEANPETIDAMIDGLSR